MEKEHLEAYNNLNGSLKNSEKTKQVPSFGSLCIHQAYLNLSFCYFRLQ